jgi:hypothetical protein
MKDFARCICADDFRDSVARPEGKNGKPAEILGKLPSSCFVHRSIFEIFGDEGSMGAGELAMRALDNFAGSCEEESEEEEEDGDPEKRTQLMLFLWSVENLRMTKVNLSDPHDNDIFDRLAQSMMRELDKLDTLAEENPKEKVGSPSALSRKSPPNKNRSTSPSNRSRDGRTDRMQSIKPPHASPDGSPLAKFRDKGREKGRRDPREGKNKGKRKPSPSPPSSDQSSGSFNQSNEEGSREPTPP